VTEPIGLTAQVWYPDGTDTADLALTERRVGARTAADLGYSTLLVSDVAPADMAVRAASRLLTRTGLDADTFGTLFHASVHYQGHDMWSAPHYIARELGCRGVPIGLQQQCNGGAIAIELARHLPEPSLITTADRFARPSFDRWRSDYGMAAGDGATAMVVHHGRLPTDLTLHGIASASTPELEYMHRGEDGFDTTPLGHGPKIDIRRTKRAFIREFGADRFVKLAHHGIRDAVTATLADAGLEPGDPRLRFAVLPRLGARALREAYIPPLVGVTPAELLDLGRATGHLGAGDLNASLADLATGDLLSPGQYALVLNGGGGFTFTAVVVRRP
jgi:3-oxoacyl-[acyl-carrier-protein] synthase-3